MMRPRLALFALAAVVSTAAAGIRPGDSLADVKAQLGAPRGQVNVDGRQKLYYERGEVELVNDSVTRVALRSPEEQAALTAREESQRAARDARRSQLFAEGTALRNQKLADPEFKSAPLAYQISFWESFAASYPGVSVLEPLTIARMKYGEQLTARQAREEKQAREEERERRLAEFDRDRTVYPLFTGSSYYGRYRPYSAPTLGPFSYTFFSSPLPPYSTPSGNPAGELTGPLITTPVLDPGIYRRGN